MVFMAALAWLPRGAIAAVGIALIVLHNVTDAIIPAAFGEFGWLWRFLHFPNPYAAGGLIRIGYSDHCVAGVMAVGYAMGPLFKIAGTQAKDSRRYQHLSRSRFHRSSMAERLWRPGAWSVETQGTYTLLSFLRVQKYPPSLAYLLMTLGPLLVALAWLERARGRVFSFFVTVHGRVPLLFYVAHIYLVHLIAVVVAYQQGGPASSYERRTNGPAPAVVWSKYWLGLRGLGTRRDHAFTPVCRAFAKVKARRGDWWLSYL